MRIPIWYASRYGTLQAWMGIVQCNVVEYAISIVSDSATLLVFLSRPTNRKENDASFFPVSSSPIEWLIIIPNDAKDGGEYIDTPFSKVILIFFTITKGISSGLHTYVIRKNLDRVFITDAVSGSVVIGNLLIVWSVQSFFAAFFNLNRPRIVAIPTISAGLGEGTS